LRFHVFCDVSERGFFVQVPPVLLAFAELLLDVEARNSAAARAARMRNVSSFRGSPGIGRSSKTAT
jgi:hypothetical protein